jgi:RNA polymerase sporulation-specific sigma factor
MPHSEESDEAKDKKSKDSEQDLQRYIALVDVIRNSTSEVVQNDAFQKISNGLESKIKKIAGRFRIPGHHFDDVLQESLYALRYKAIKDYDQTRGKGPGPASFEGFALMCIRRHLATTLKTSRQNKKKVLNTYKSLVNILPKTKGDVVGEIQSKEFFRTLVNKLLARLSEFEKHVFYLYAHGYTYEEVSDYINNNALHEENVDIKGVDNALSRIKNKARVIYRRTQAAAGEPAVIGKKKYKHLYETKGKRNKEEAEPVNRMKAPKAKPK